MTWYMYKFAYIVVIEFELFKVKQVLDVGQRTRNEVVHANNMVTLVDESVAKMRTKEAGSAGNQNSFHLLKDIRLALLFCKVGQKWFIFYHKVKLLILRLSKSTKNRAKTL